MKVVVIGASSGLGRCIAMGLAAEGAQVALMGRRLGRLERAATEAGDLAIPVACDVTDQSSVLRFIEDNWHLGRLGHQSSDAIAGSLGGLFDFDEQHERAPQLLLSAISGNP